MIELLKIIESNIEYILTKKELKSLDIDYYSPRVERLYLDLPDNRRLFFHVIHKTQDDFNNLYHPHPWPSCMHVLEGKYEMGLSYSENPEHYIETENNKNYNDIIKNEICKIEVNSGMYYEMLNRNGWHYVKSLSDISYSVMLIDKPWYKGNKAPYQLKELSKDRVEEIKNKFLSFYKNL